MLKALFHKQMLEVRRAYFYNKKKGTMVSGKSGTTGRTILFIILYLIIAGSMFALSFLVGDGLIQSGGAWIYFMVMTILAFLIGIIGSVMTTAAALFQAKDNEFLLAMPIPPSKILIARMISVYIMGLIYESVVMLPAIIVYFILGRPTVLSVIFCILSIFVLGFLVLTFSCFFGWLIALLSSKLKNKSFLTVIISVIFIGLFVYLRFRANEFFRYISTHGKEIGEAVQGWGYPLYSLGLGMSGDILAFLVFTVITAALFALTCFLLSKSFRRIVTVNNEATGKAFSDSQIRTRSIAAALRKKEFKRFTSSPNYMLNNALGVLFLIAGAVIALIKMQDVRALLDLIIKQSPFMANMIPVFGAFAVCLLTPLCDVAAPAISLEGKSIWVLQALPVDPYEVFKAKMFVHIAVAWIPSMICGIVLIIVLKVGVLAAICMLLCITGYVVLGAEAMLALDLKRPMMDWTNETQPIKQSINILIDWMGGLLLALVLGGLASLLSIVTGAEIALLFCTALFVLFILLLRKWFRGKGRQLFAEL